MSFEIRWARSRLPPICWSATCRQAMPSRKELAGYISSEVDRTNSLVSRFLDFARPLEIRRSPADSE